MATMMTTPMDMRRPTNRCRRDGQFEIQGKNQPPLMTRTIALLTLLGFPIHADHHRNAYEVNLSNEDFKKLSNFESHLINKADKAYNKEDYKTAFAEYDSFILEYPESLAIPYAILRKARSMQLRNKRFQAVKIYQEILDYFPNHVQFAAPAIFYIGECHSDNGDPEKAFKAWAAMAQDKEYSKHFLAAGALNRLADNMIKLEHVDQAIKYYSQIAIDFRTTNAQAARYAREKVAAHYIRFMQEGQLLQFYKDVNSFEDRPFSVPADIDKDARYWGKVRQLVHQNGRFEEVQVSQKKEYFGYWAKTLNGKIPEWDDFQADVAYFFLYADGNKDAWSQRLDDQFNRYQKPGDTGRVLKWMERFSGHKAKVQEYYQKLDFGKMSNSEIKSALEVLWDRCREYAIAKTCYEKFQWDKMSDNDKDGLARTLWHKDAGLLKETCMRFEEKERGLSIMLSYYRERRDAVNGLPLTDKLESEPKYAKLAYYSRGDLLYYTNKFKEAIMAYQQADNPPDTLWKIVSCYKKMGEVKRAVSQLTEIENFFKEQAPEAAIQIAQIYQGAGMKKESVSAFRKVLRKYPDSGQSSKAHEALEALGERIGGGSDAEDN